MRFAFAIITFALLFLINATNQVQLFSKSRRNELEKLQKRLPVKNYLTLQDNEKRRVNKYKHDLSEESDEEEEEDGDSNFVRRRFDKSENVKSFSKRNSRNFKFKSRDDSEEEEERKPRRILDREGPNKYSKQKNRRALSDEDQPDKIKQKKRYNSYEDDDTGKKPYKKRVLKKNAFEKDDSSEDSDAGLHGQPRKHKEVSHEDNSSESLCDSLDEECDM